MTTLLANGNPEEIQIPNTHGDLVLHIACRFSPSAEVVEELLKMYPEGASHINHAQQTALECCTQNSTNAAIEIAKMVAAVAPQHIRCLRKKHPVSANILLVPLLLLISAPCRFGLPSSGA